MRWHMSGPARSPGRVGQFRRRARTRRKFEGTRLCLGELRPPYRHDPGQTRRCGSDTRRVADPRAGGACEPGGGAMRSDRGINKDQLIVTPERQTIQNQSGARMPASPAGSPKPRRSVRPLARMTDGHRLRGLAGPVFRPRARIHKIAVAVHHRRSHSAPPRCRAELVAGAPAVGEHSRPTHTAGAPKGLNQAQGRGTPRPYPVTRRDTWRETEGIHSA